MKDIFAKVTSNVFNPFAVAVILLVLLSLKAGNGFKEAVTWLSITIAISVIPELIIVYVLIRLKKLDSFFSNPREQRNTVYLLAAVLGVIDCALLWLFKGPELLAVIFTAGLIGVLIFMVVNYFWKISLHTAFVAASVAVLIMEYGAYAAWASLVVPLVGWSRIILKQHSALQVFAGGLVAVVVVIGAFWGFGLIG